MIGERLRELRQMQGKSLADIAGKAKISVATLSRIETDKQSVDVDLLIILAGVLGTQAREILSESDQGTERREELAQRIAGMDTRKRADFWRDLATERRNQRGRDRAPRDVTQQVEELLAQVDFLREELEAVRSRVRKRR